MRQKKKMCQKGFNANSQHKGKERRRRVHGSIPRKETRPRLGGRISGQREWHCLIRSSVEL